MGRSEEFEVVVVGASLAGCAVAILLGRQGFNVAMVDKHRDEQAYKRLCGHYIQASATPAVRRLELDRAIEGAGGVRNGLDFSTRWGVIGSPLPVHERPYGFSLRREKLDPLIRERAASLPTVDYRSGQRAVALHERSERRTELEVEDRGGRRRRLKARLIVGADGRNSAVAKLAGIKERSSRNRRFCYASYFTGVALPKDSRGRLWLREPDVMIAAPQDEGLAVLAVFGHQRELHRFGHDRPKALLGFMHGLPGLDLTNAEIQDKVIGYKNYDLIARSPTAGSSIALVGDAALSSDPTMGVGCGWALQSAEWLADAVVPALEGDVPIRVSLKRYKKRHRRELQLHHRILAIEARAWPVPPVQRMLFAAGATDPMTARMLSEFGQRLVPPGKLMQPRVLGRAAGHLVVSRGGALLHRRQGQHR